MGKEAGLAAAAELFKVLGNESRLWLMRLLTETPTTVGALTELTGMSQPLVSQHLRTLRQAGLVTATRNGKEVTYRVADEHVVHVIADAVAHTQEDQGDQGSLRNQGDQGNPESTVDGARGHREKEPT